MNADEKQLIYSVLSIALELEPEYRLALIESRCEGDPRLVQEVQRLLDLEERASRHSVLSDPAIDDSRVKLERMLDEQLGETDARSRFIGPYEIVREIGRGGMGVVYECRQRIPDRRVAVKIVESLLFGHELSKRLEAEAQIQGQLQHPGITRVYDAGIAKVGRSHQPYFVMELINGRPLNAFASSARLTTREKLMLMAKVCDGVMHAQEQGIVHRDLKPDNILVEADGQPKIMDFGIARFVGESTLAATAITREGQVLGTLAYMAPEQLSGPKESLSARADVYALGVIMHELLVGHPPMQLEGLSLSAAFRTIEMEDPTSIRTHDASLSKEIDTIVNRCLSREPEMRFPNAGELADDIRRHLTDRPIRSQPPTKRYIAGKFIRRHRLLVGAGTATLLALVIGLVFSLYFAAGQRDARLLAEQEQRRARSKEIDAIRGVLSGSGMLVEGGQRWEAVRQLKSVDPESRGWEWYHAAVTLPWTLDGLRITTLDPSSFGIIAEQRFIDNGHIFSNNPRTFRSSIQNIYSGEYVHSFRELSIKRSERLYQRFDDTIFVQLTDDSIGRLDLQTHSYNEILSSELVDGAALRTVSLDGSMITTVSGSYIRVFECGRVVFEMDSEIGNPRAMNWNDPVFARDGTALYLPKWGGNGEIIAVDTSKWAVSHRRRSRANGVNIAVSPDNELIYATTQRMGVQILRANDLEQIGSLDAKDGVTEQIRLSADGSRLAVCFSNRHELRVYDTSTLEVVRSEELDSGRLQRTPHFSPDGRLLLTFSPKEFWPWIVPSSAAAPRSVSSLETDSGNISRLSVSSDGALLASAQVSSGSITLWDLMSSRPIAHIEDITQTGSNEEDIPTILAFAPDGQSLYVSGSGATESEIGLSRLDLRTGSLTRIESGSLENVLRYCADQTGHGSLSRRAVSLPNRRVVFAGTNVVRVLSPGAAPGGSTILNENSARQRGGAAVHPSGTQYAAAEYSVIRIRDAQTDEVLFGLPDASLAATFGMAYSPDGSRLAVGTTRNRVLLFDTEFYKKVAEFTVPFKPDENPKQHVLCVAWTPDGKRLIASGGRAIRILESEPWERPTARTDQAPIDGADNRGVTMIRSWADGDRQP